MHQSRQRQTLFDLEFIKLVEEADLIRSEHPGCGVEKLYTIMKPKYVGRDKFCEIFMDLGYRVRRLKNYTRTTVAAHFNYPNLIQGMAVTHPYQVLQSDITYFYLNGRFYYLVFIIDVYTREILGYNVDDNMRAESNLKALKMALKKVPKQQYEGMIHHSDRGAQYGSNVYVKELKSKGIKISMGLIAQDNAYAERVNGIIKNEYLNRWHIGDYNSLKKKTTKAVKHYNRKRLHLAFYNNYSPLAFKETLLDLNTQERPMVIIYAEGNYKTRVASSHPSFNPREEPLAHNCPIVIN